MERIYSIVELRNNFCCGRYWRGVMVGLMVDVVFVECISMVKLRSIDYYDTDYY